MLTVSPIEAGQMHSDVSIITYTDFGQNKGRYVTGESVNALLQHIRDTEGRDKEGGIAIHYTDGTTPYLISNEQGMISFAGTGDNGAYAAIAPNTTATVNHNDSNNASFGGRVVGGSHAISYSAIDIRYSSTFRLTEPNGFDYALQRQSKIITDALYNPLSSETDANAFLGQHLYHSGGGEMAMYVEGSGYKKMAGAYIYIIGGIDKIKEVWSFDSGNQSVISNPAYGNGVGADTVNPLPNGIQQGDSGSPIFVYNTNTKQYEYVSTQQSGNATGGDGWSQARGNVQWTKDTLESFNAHVSMTPETDTVYLNAINTAGETKSDGKNSATLYSGQATDASGQVLASYNGVQSGVNTWKDLSGLKDTQNWYAYHSDSYLQKSDAELFFTNNLIFSSTAEQNNIILNDTVDLGIGYAEFKGGHYTISSEGEESNRFNHAGYVINAGASVHLRLNNPADHMTEWRKIGAGDLYIDGEGATNALLNVGGSGTTYLQQSGGYAAYNVLANTGATVVISNTSQIARDFTFGAGGGTLDMNGNSMEWYTTTTADGRFTINALTEEAVITNSNGASLLTFKESGETTFLGSFRDSESGSLRIDYQGGGTLTLHSIHTNLSEHADSGLTVSSGKVILSGTNTVHGKGSASGTNANRLLRDNDWHYADATMNVHVANGGTFELGSHARLTGDVTVEDGGTFIMREGVRHTMEYVEGGHETENTGKYSAFYGHKGNVQLNGGTFAVQFNDGVDSITDYSGNVTGSGSITVDAGKDGGILHFRSATDAGISRTLNGGTLILGGAAAADDSTQWLVQGGGQMLMEQRHHVNTASTGTLVLSEDTSEQVDMGDHRNMLLGAVTGATVQYGTEGTTETLRSLNLGGSGTLVVHYVLSGQDTLTVDGRGNRTGEVQLRRIADDFSGTLHVKSEGGRMVLNAGDTYSLSNIVANIGNGGVLKANHLSVSGAQASVELYGSLEYDTLTVRDGATLNLRDGGRLDTEHAATIAEGGIMRLNTQTLQDKVELKNGGIMYGNGGTISNTANVKATEGTGVLSAEGGTFNVNGQIGASKDATLRLESGTFNIYTGSINAAGGTLELACNTVNLGHKVNNATQNIGGTLNIANNLTIAVRQGDPSIYQGITHNINHLNISNGSHLSLTESGDDWRHVFNIANITGKGSITWSSVNRWFNNTLMGASRLILTGDNSFEGIFTVNQTDNRGSMQHLALAHDNAAKNMVILLNGDSNSRPGLAISTANAHVVALGGSGADTFVYAGAVKTAYNGDNPTSTALNTLTLTTSELYTYDGTLLGSETTGLNIVMDGTGRQAFKNAANVVHDITALRGTLNFINAPTIHGDVSIAQGATLQIGSAYSLDAGHALHVLPGAAGGSATLNSSLILNGGELNFGVYNADGSASLRVNGVNLGTSFSNTLALSFSNTADIQHNVGYLLASGDWSALNGKLTVSDSEYLTAILTAGSNGLYATFSMNDMYTAWEGDNGALTSDAHVVFAGFGGADSVELSSDTNISTAYFDNEDTFTVSSDNGSTLSTSGIVKNAQGDLVLNTAVSADSMQVKDNTVISGSGSLSVGSLETEADLTTGLTINATEIQGNGHRWVMTGSESSFTQQMSVAQANTFSSLAVEASATLEIAANEAATLSTGISGSGTVDKVGSGKLTATGAILVDNFCVSSGEFEAKGTVDIERLSVASGATATIYNQSGADGADKHLGTVELGKGATFQTYDNDEATKATSIGSIKLTGDAATLQDMHNSGYYHVGALSMDASVDKATLNIVKNAASSKSTVVELGGAEAAAGNFAGTIVLNSVTGDSGADKRSLFLVLSGQESAAKAVVNLAAANSSSAVLGLGVNADDTVIAGLESGAGLGIRAKVFSGTVGTQIQWGSSTSAPNGVGTTERTLHINTGSGAEHNFYGEVMSHLNLIISGTGKQTFSGTSSGFNGSITVNGGTLALGSNAESMLTQASSVIVNEGGTLDLTTVNTSDTVTVSNISGSGTLGLNLSTDSYGQTLTVSSDFTGTTHIKQGHFTINGSTFGNTLKLGGGVHFQLNGGSTVTLDKDMILEGTSQVHQNTNANLTITGTVTGSGTYDRRGGGTLNFNNTVNLGEFKQEVSDVTTNFKGNTTLGVMTLKRSTVSLSYAGDGGNFVNLLDGSCGGTANGSLRLKENTKLNVGYQLWGRSQSSVVLEKDAALTHGSVQFSNRGTQDATLKTSSNDSLYSVDGSDWSLTGGHLTADSDSEMTLRTQLINSSVENAGSGKLTVNNAANSITDVYASAGDMAIMQQAAGLNLEELVVAADKTVSVYTATAEANVTVHGRAEFGKNAVLNANLTLASGSSLSVAEGGLAMGSTLSLQKGITLDDATLKRVYSLNTGESVVLFTGVDGLKLGETSYTSISANDEILASPYFSNLNSDQYRLTYTGTNNGTLSILSAAVPEPTSSMLGLMGLVAFSFRRRRK